MIWTFAFLLGFFELTAQAQTAPQRVVALSPLVAEWTADLLGESEALRRMVGVSEFSQYPPSLKKIPTVGPYPKIQIESVLSLKPDLVLALEGANRSEQIEKLKRLKLSVVVLPAEKFEKMGSWIEQLGQALGAPQRGTQLRNHWEFEIKSLEPRATRRIFVEIQHQPLITLGSASFLSQALSKVGVVNVFADLPQAYPKVSAEAVFRSNPDEIWVMDLQGGGGDFERSRKKWSEFTALKAAKNQKIKSIPGDDFARCSLRLLKALKAIR